MKKFLTRLATFVLIAVLAFSFAACGDYIPPDDNNNDDFDFQTVYSAAVELGFDGSLEDLIEAFKGDSAYQVAVANGYTGTQAEWLMTLVGASGRDGRDGAAGKDGTTPHIGSNGNWWIGSTDTGVKAQGTNGAAGKDGTTPHIGTNGNWWIGSTDTGVKAQGTNGAAGKDGTTPHIGTNGNWWIGSTDTGVNAQGTSGTNGLTPYIGSNGNWWVASTDTGVKAQGVTGATGKDGTNGTTPHIGTNGNWWIGSTDTGVNAQGTSGTNGTNGTNGQDGTDGTNGKSAYEIYKSHNPGYTGTEAQWVEDLANGRLAKYTVTFDENISDSSNPNIQQISNITKSAKIAETEVRTPTREGHAFVGWYKERACKNEWVFEDDTVEQNTTLYAKWTNEAILLECENGKIVSHKNTAWTDAFIYQDNSSGSIVYEAVPDNGYYFEKWVYLKLDGTEWTEYSWSQGQNYYNFFDKYSADMRVRNTGRGYGSAVYLKAVFTNDIHKLEDVKEPNYQVNTVGEVSYTTNKLPAKKVKGTKLVKYFAASENAYVTKTDKVFGKDGDFIRNAVKSTPDVLSQTKAYICSDSEFINSTFGVVDTLIITITEKSKVTLVKVEQSRKLRPLDPGVFTFINGSNLFFLERGTGGFIYSPVLMGFQKWTDEYGNLLSTDIGIYLNADRDLISLIAHYDHKYTDFEFVEGPLRFNPINGGTEYEVQYNYAANQNFETVYVEASDGYKVPFNYLSSESFGTVTIPETYNGKPVTKIADYGFATRYGYVAPDYIQLVSIQKLIVPESIQEVGLHAFSTMHHGISWPYKTESPYTVEFLSENTKVSIGSFEKADCNFILTDGQLQNILDELSAEYLNLTDKQIEIELFDQTQKPGVGGYYTLDNPNTLFVSDVIFNNFNMKTLFTIMHEFRHLYQLAACGVVDGITVKTDISEAVIQEWAECLSDYQYNSYAIEDDASGFAYAKIGVSYLWLSLNNWD